MSRIPERESYKALERALERAAEARACVAQNRGYEKEQAREAYGFALDELGACLRESVEDAIGDLDPKQIESLARTLQKMLWRKQVLK